MIILRNSWKWQTGALLFTIRPLFQFCEDLRNLTGYMLAVFGEVAAYRFMSASMARRRRFGECIGDLIVEAFANECAGYKTTIFIIWA